jgi:hypothetical protein
MARIEGVFEREASSCGAFRVPLLPAVARIRLLSR